MMATPSALALNFLIASRVARLSAKDAGKGAGETTTLRVIPSRLDAWVDRQCRGQPQLPISPGNGARIGGPEGCRIKNAAGGVGDILTTPQYRAPSGSIHRPG